MLCSVKPCVWACDPGHEERETWAEMRFPGERAEPSDLGLLPLEKVDVFFPKGTAISKQSLFQE